MECTHTPKCPAATAADRCHAHVTSDRTDQGWQRLCNGVILFTDGGALLPDGALATVR